MAAQALMDEPG